MKPVTTVAETSQGGTCFESSSESSPLAFLWQRFAASASKDAVVWGDRTFTYGDLCSTIEALRPELASIQPGEVVSLESEFSPVAMATLLLLVERGTILVPISELLPEGVRAYLRQIGHVQKVITISESGLVAEKALGGRPHLIISDHAVSADSSPLISKFRNLATPGLILFSSGSSGVPKAAFHDFSKLLEKFQATRQRLRMISFLLFDHIGGINTLFYCLSNTGCLILLKSRNPAYVAAQIEKYRADTLPTTPTFLRLLLLSDWQANDFSSLRLITYGTEPMPASTLEQLHLKFPNIRFQQTYGLSELGILRSRSRGNNSTWLQIGGEQFQTRVSEGLLEIKADSSMLGYLNAPSPFTADGWFKTGDYVEQDGPWLRILGRQSEVINVGGEKVFPSEVESVLQEMEGVESVTVSGEPNAVLGMIVAAKVKLKSSIEAESRIESIGEFRVRMRQFCKDRLANFKTPQKVVFEEADQHTLRFKKQRKT